MKKIFISIFLVSLIFVAFVSCELVDSQHNHKYSRVWSTTETEHWREASCEHTDLVANLGKHRWDDGTTTLEPTEDAEGIFSISCTICGYTKESSIEKLDHTHKFDMENWQSNLYTHWHAATCEHSDRTTIPEAHAFNGNVCVICDYVTVSSGFEYTLLSDGTYEISGRGQNYDSILILPSSYEGKPITSIGERAFSNDISKSVKKVVIPKSIKSIGKSAFSECQYVEEIVFEEGSSLENIGASAFYCCDARLTSIALPASVKTLGNGAFFGCKKLESFTVEEGNEYLTVIDGSLYSKDGTTLIQYALGKENASFTIPSSVTIIGYGAFAYAPSLTDISFEDGNQLSSVSAGAFYYCSNIKSITLPSSVTFYDKESFSQCTALETLTMPDSLMAIGNEAFFNCNLLNTISIPSGVKTIGARAFGYCYKITELVIPDSVTKIGDEFVLGCKNLLEVSIPKSVTHYGERLFYGASSLKNITVDDNNAILKAINGNLYSKGGKTLLYYCVAKTETTFEVPAGVTTIANSAFCASVNLSKIILPDSVTKIGKEAFLVCKNLSSINLPNSITSIGEKAFGSCESLKNITLPSGLSVISKDLFNNCKSLESIEIGTNIKLIEERAFAYLANLKNIVFVNTEGWSRQYEMEGKHYKHDVPSEDIANSEKAAVLLTTTYPIQQWVWTAPTE